MALASYPFEWIIDAAYRQGWHDAAVKEPSRAEYCGLTMVEYYRLVAEACYQPLVDAYSQGYRECPADWCQRGC